MKEFVNYNALLQQKQKVNKFLWGGNAAPILILELFFVIIIVVGKQNKISKKSRRHKCTIEKKYFFCPENIPG